MADSHDTRIASAIPQSTTRRSIITAGAAAIGATAVAVPVAISGAVAGEDPIFAALAESERAYAAFRQVDDAEDGGHSPEWDASRLANAEADIALYSTKPTTPAGAAMFLRLIADFLDQDDVVNDLWVGDMIGDSIRNAVAVLEQEARA